MAELSDDTLSDDDALKRGEELEEGHPMRGLVFHWSTHGFWGSKALGDDDRAWADDKDYKLLVREAPPTYLQDRVRLVPRVFEGPPPPTADAAFRAALVGDVFGYYPLAYKIRIGSVVSKETLKYVRGRPIDLTKIRGGRASYEREPKRFTADDARALIEGGTWRVSGVALSQMTTRATVRGLPLANVTNLDLSYMQPCRINGPEYNDKSRLKTLDCLSACPALRRLVLSHRFGVRDLAPIASLQHLEELDLYECVNVTDISPLASCPKLTTLNLSLCRGLEDAALQPLAAITSLRTLRLNYCLGITRLPNLESLTSLDLEHCTDIRDLADCGLPERLKTLSFCWREWAYGKYGEQRGANLADLAPLGRLERLTSLDLSNARCVGSLEPLALLPLVELNLQAICPGPGLNDPEYYDSDGERLGERLDEPRGGPYPTTIDLTPIGQIKTLVRLNLNYLGEHVDADALAVLRGLLKLESLEIHGTGRENRGFQRFYHLAGHPTLRKLDLGYALLTDADLTFLPSLPELTYLGIHSNLPKSMIEDVTKRCPKLINLPRY